MCVCLLVCLFFIQFRSWTQICTRLCTLVYFYLAGVTVRVKITTDISKHIKNWAKMGYFSFSLCLYCLEKSYRFAHCDETSCYFVGMVAPWSSTTHKLQLMWQRLSDRPELWKWVSSGLPLGSRSSSSISPPSNCPISHSWTWEVQRSLCLRKVTNQQRTLKITWS